jgi:hypothetical protein
MRSEEEIRKLRGYLVRITHFISEFGNYGEYGSASWAYAWNVSDGLQWVLEEIDTAHFRSDAYLNLESLKQLARNIEERTGKRLEDYE